MKKIHFTYIVIFFLLIQEWSHAQSKKVDSLKGALNVSTEANRYEVLWGLAYELYDVDNPQALTFAKEANIYALKEGDTLDIVMSGRILGQLLRRADKVEESIKTLTNVLSISKRHNFGKETKLILNALALGYFIKADYDKSLEHHFQSLYIREKEGDKKQISIALNNIGIVYLKLSNLDLALAYFIKSLNAKEESNDTFDLDVLLINIGLCYIDLADYKNGQKYFEKAFKVCAPSCSNQVFISGEYGIGRSFKHQKNYTLAEIHFKKSLNLAVIENNQRFQLENLMNLAEISLLRNDLEMGKIYLNRTELLPEMNQYGDFLLNYYQLRADYHTRSKEFQKANSFQRKYSELKDSVYDAKMYKNIAKIQTQYAERENLANIKSQSKVISLQTDAISRQRLLNIAIGAVAFLIVGLAIILYKINRQKQKINEILDQRVKERTCELEKNRDELKHTHDEQALVLKKVTSDLTSSLATIKGLSNTATKDLPQEHAIYFKEAEATTERLVNYVNKYSAPT